jgi:hypothetical protein
MWIQKFLLCNMFVDYAQTNIILHNSKKWFADFSDSFHCLKFTRKTRCFFAITAGPFCRYLRFLNIFSNGCCVETLRVKQKGFTVLLNYIPECFASHNEPQPTPIKIGYASILIRVTSNQPLTKWMVEFHIYPGPKHEIFKLFKTT